ncbi:MAG: hypothetical protein EBU90_24230 [Proteobacteria bacterium]|nr:hypothetical protein [Pseudomonadota bacterium]NBP16271.1 hypothetical protein [bacterium]
MEKINFKSYILNKDVLQEQTKSDTYVLAYGRFNPPTKLGHGKLIQKTVEEAEKIGQTPHVLLSHSHDPEKNPEKRKNPVDPELKAAAIQHSFPKTKVSTSNKDRPTLLHHLSDMYDKGIKNLILVAGSDRVDEYKERLNKFNGKQDVHGYYNMNIDVKSAGQRDPDGESEEGGLTSGTAARRAALSGDKDRFMEGILGSDEHKQEMLKQINSPKKSLKEDYDNPYRYDWGTPEGTNYMINMTPGISTKCEKGFVYSNERKACVPLRETFIANKIFKMGDTVIATDGEVGEIVYRGSNYVTLQLKENTKKYWISDIQELQEDTIEKSSPRITYKQKFYEKKVPALLMNKSQLKEQNKKNTEISYMGYTTKHLDMCPDASTQLHVLVTKNLNPKFILQAIKATDQYLEIEKQAVKVGFANEETVHDFLMKFIIAHDTLNMLGYVDKDLLYMKKHLDVMSKLAMHRDSTFANEPYSTLPMSHIGEIDESEFVIRGRADPGEFKKVYAKNYRLKLNSRTGKYYKVSNSIITKGHKKIEDEEDQEDKGDSMQIKEQHPYITTAEQEKTHARDINSASEKEVFHGVDAPITDQGHDGKPLGLVSFKTFMNQGMNKNLAAVHEKDRQDIHRAQVQDFQQPSLAYIQMRKVKLQDN